MHSLLILTSLLPSAHLFAYSTLLGTQLYQSFIMVKIAHRALPYEAFTLLQKRVFPVYFRSQSVLLLFTAATFPGQGPISLIQEKGNWVPFVVAGVTSALNMMIFGPRTSHLMMLKRYQSEVDARKLGDGAVSDEMKRIRRSSSGNHVMSIHLNLITLGATLWYGWILASKLQYGE